MPFSGSIENVKEVEVQELNTIELSEECPYCGAMLHLETTAQQPDDDKRMNTVGYVCSDMDKAFCPVCGLIGHMVLDGEGFAYFQYDPDSDENTVAYDRAGQMDGGHD